MYMMPALLTVAARLLYRSVENALALCAARLTLTAL